MNYGRTWTAEKREQRSNHDALENIFGAIYNAIQFAYVPCECCGNTWDYMSPCAPCNATRAFPTFRI